MFAFLKKFCYWLPVITISLGIIALSSIQNPPQPEVNIPFLDKIIHSGVYCLLGICYFYSFTSAFQKISCLRVIIAFLAAVFFGGLDEFYQSFVPTRSPEFLDWVADFFGVCCGFLLVFVYQKRSTAN